MYEVDTDDIDNLCDGGNAMIGDRGIGGFGDTDDLYGEHRMYLSIIALPLLSGVISGLIGRKIGKGGSEVILKGSITISTILGMIGFYEVVIRKAGVIIEIGRMIETENVEVS